MKKKRNVKRAHAVWNKHNPENPIIKGDGYCIHHKDENPENDSPDNLQKMIHGEHNSFHNKGKQYSLGIKHTMATRNKMSASMKKLCVGKGNGFYGKRHTIETKLKMSKIRTGKIMTEETKQKLSIVLTGKKRTDETKQKISEMRKKTGSPWLLGTHHTMETKLKISLATKGRMPWNKGEKLCNEEVRKKMSISAKARCLRMKLLSNK